MSNFRTRGIICRYLQPSLFFALTGPCSLILAEEDVLTTAPSFAATLHSTGGLCKRASCLHSPAGFHGGDAWWSRTWTRGPGSVSNFSHLCFFVFFVAISLCLLNISCHFFRLLLEWVWGHNPHPVSGYGTPACPPGLGPSLTFSNNPNIWRWKHGLSTFAPLFVVMVPDFIPLIRLKLFCDNSTWESNQLCGGCGPVGGDAALLRAKSW